MPGPLEARQAASVVIGLAVENEPVLGVRRLFGQGNHLESRRALELGQARPAAVPLPEAQAPGAVIVERAEQVARGARDGKHVAPGRTQRRPGVESVAHHEQ